MTDSKHTPGPWRAVLSDSAVPYGYWAVLDIEGYPVGTHSGEFDRADALLIAAAPELLEALVGCLSVLEKLGHEENHQFKKGCAAIDKTTGDKT